MSNGGIPRRDFLKGATVTGLNLAALGLLGGCSPTTATATEESSSANQDTANTTTSSGDAASGTTSWRTPPTPVTEFASTYEADVIVCGHGYAGITSCREIAEAGHSVILIEKQAEDTYMAVGNEAALPNLPWLLDLGEDSIDPVEFFNNWQMNTNNTSIPGLMMKYPQNAAANGARYFDQCTEEDYATFTTAFFPKAENLLSNIGAFKFWVSTISCYGDCNQTKLQGYNRQVAIDNGAQVLFGTEAQYLQTDENGAVTGVVATDADGNYILLNSKAVVIATGGFGGNQEMQKDLLTDLGNCLNSTDDFTVLMDRDGRGIQMGYWIGAKLESFGIATMNGKHFYPGYPQSLWLDPSGKRYTNEFWGPIEYRGRPTLYHNKGTYYSFYDDNITDYLKYVAPSHGSTDPSEENLTSIRETLTSVIAAGSEGVQGEAMSATYVDYGAQTLDELFALIGVSDEVAATMKSSIEHYNTLCENGYDEDFGRDSNLLFPVKQAPFYCRVKTPVLGWMMCTCGGLIVNAEQQVMGEDWNPIPGLFASGNCSGSRYGSEYFTPIPGCSLGTAITLGFECGKSVVKYLNGEI